MATIYSYSLFDKSDYRSFNLEKGYIVKVAFLLALSKQNLHKTFFDS